MLSEYEAREVSRSMKRELEAGPASVLLSAAGVLAVIAVAVFGDMLLPPSSAPEPVRQASQEQTSVSCPAGQAQDCPVERTDN
jgi:hypothetical protein